MANAVQRESSGRGNMIGGLTTVTAMLFAGQLFAAVTARYTFDDPNDLLKASVGSDAIVKAFKIEPVSGIGNLTPTNGYNRIDGAGAVVVPLEQYLAIPHGLDKTTGSRWFVRMRFFLPDGDNWRSFLQLNQGNDEYPMLYFKPTPDGGELGCSPYWGNYIPCDNLAGRWHTLALSCDGTKTTLYVDGVSKRTTQNGAPFSGGSDLTGVDYFYISTGNVKSDGYPMFIDDILIGTGTYEENVVEAPVLADVKTWNGRVRSNAIAATGYTVTATNGIDVGFYPVTLSLTDKTKVWGDTATSADRISYFAIREAVLCPELRSHLTFDDAGNGGLNLLKATVGADAIVREGNPATNVCGIGSMCATNGEFHLDGVGAVFVPKKPFLSIPHGLKQTTGARYRIDMRFRGPTLSDSQLGGILSLNPNNTGDAVLFMKGKTWIGLTSYWGGYATIPSIENRWYTVSVVSEGTSVSCWVDGTWYLDGTSSCVTRLTDLSQTPSFSIAADNDGEVFPMSVDDIKIYAETERIRVAPPQDAGSCVFTGTPQSPVAPKSRYYAVKSGATGTEIGTYPVTFGLLDPDHTTWLDGTTADKTVNFTISAAANEWTVAPAIGATTWVAGKPAPACQWNVSAKHGTPSVMLDGKPFDGKLPTAAGRYTLTYSVPATTDWTGLSCEYELFVLADEGALPQPALKAASYVGDGLVMSLDAIENAGVGVHDNTSTVWKDLSGNGYDWEINLENATWSANGLDFLGTGVCGSRTSDTLTFANKLTTVEFLWKTALGSASFIFTPGLSGNAYIFVDPKGGLQGIGLRDNKRVLTPLNQDVSYSVLYERAVGTSSPTGVTNVQVNASQAEIVSGDYWTLGSHQRLGGREGSPMPAKGTLRTLRVYDRPLTLPERALNAYVDVHRYGIGNLSATAVDLDGYRQEGAVVLTHVTVKSKDGRISMDGADWSQDQTVWVPVGTPVTVDLKFRGVIPERISAFDLAGLPSDTIVSSDGKKLTFVASVPVSAMISHPDALGFGIIMVVR